MGYLIGNVSQGIKLVTFTCSESTIEELEKGEKHFQS